LTDHAAKVIRNGEITVVPAKDLVPGDVVVLDTGDYIPADLRVIEAVNLKSQEASLTGESVPVEKNTGVIEDSEVGLGDRVNMLFSSSLVTYGRGKGIVVATGMETEVGKIAGMLDSTEEQTTPLQDKLNKLGKTLGIAALAICVFIFIIGLIQGKEPIHMFMTAVSLAVAAIPEGLVAVSTIVLAIGVQKMVKKNAIVKKLPAVETLGSATVICSDKTGTLTQNKMTVEKVFWNNGVRELSNIKENEIDAQLKKLVYANMRCNDTKISNDGTLTGDPTETALVDMAFKLDFDPSIYDRTPRIEEVPFDSDRKLMTTVNEQDGKYIVYTKGGIDELLSRCTAYEINGKINEDLGSYINKIREHNEEMAKEALRVLGCAYKELDHKPTKEEMENIESNLIFVGMVGMIDPAREEAKVAVEKCKTAGIKTVMITGDHIVTASAIAKELGIMQENDYAILGNELSKMSDEELSQKISQISVYARVSPENKVRIVKAWQANNKIVAMTGDGVNDAPSLKQADIGIGMGITGTEVSKGAADMVLADDNFATIVEAIKQGRKVFANIQKAILYLMSCNVGEVLTVFMMTMLGWDILMPVQLLWINLVTDTLPAIALGVEPVEPGIMKNKPRGRKSNFFSGGVASSIIYQGILEGILVLGAYQLGLHVGPHVGNAAMQHADALTMAFLTLGLIQLFHAFNSKFIHKSIFRAQTFENKWFNGAILISALVMAAVEIPFLTKIFDVTELDGMQWLVVIVAGFLMIIIVEIVKFFERKAARK